jgi:hypothetical protein
MPAVEMLDYRHVGTELISGSLLPGFASGNDALESKSARLFSPSLLDSPDACNDSYCIRISGLLISMEVERRPS